MKTRTKIVLLVGATIAATALLLCTLMWMEAEASCHTKRCWRAVHAHRVWDQCVRRHGATACTFRKRWEALPAARRGYIRALMKCEAGIPYDQDGSGFILRAEWTPQTWRNAGGGPGIPSYAEEGVRVHRTLQEVGYHTTAGWPNCP